MTPQAIASLIRWHKEEVQDCSRSYAAAQTSSESRRWLSRLRNHSRTVSALEEYLNDQVQAPPRPIGSI